MDKERMELMFGKEDDKERIRDDVLHIEREDLKGIFNGGNLIKSDNE